MNNAILFPRYRDGQGGPGITRIEPSQGGAQLLQQIVTTYFDAVIRRAILGQSLSGEAAATGLGSGVAAFHQDTLQRIIKYDAAGLAESLTADFVRSLSLFINPKLLAPVAVQRGQAERGRVPGGLSRVLRDGRSGGRGLPTRGDRRSCPPQGFLDPVQDGRDESSACGQAPIGTLSWGQTAPTTGWCPGGSWCSSGTRGTAGQPRPGLPRPTPWGVPVVLVPCSYANVEPDEGSPYASLCEHRNGRSGADSEPGRGRQGPQVRRRSCGASADSVHPATITAGDAGSSGAVAVLPEAVDDLTAHYLAAWAGIYHDLPGVVIFRSDPEGPDRAYSLTLTGQASPGGTGPGLELADLRQRALLQTRGKQTLILLDLGGFARDSVERLADLLDQQGVLDGPVLESAGHGDYLGGSNPCRKPAGLPPGNPGLRGRRESRDSPAA